jgi:ABC-type phosphate transport system permease subunit
MAKKTPGTPSAPKERGPIVKPLSPTFRLIFLTVAGLTIISLLAAIYLATLGPEKQSEEIKRLVETCSTTWKMGFGGIIGLIAGKSAP